MGLCTVNKINLICWFLHKVRFLLSAKNWIWAPLFSWISDFSCKAETYDDSLQLNLLNLSAQGLCCPITPWNQHRALCCLPTFWIWGSLEENKETSWAVRLNDVNGTVCQNLHSLRAPTAPADTTWSLKIAKSSHYVLRNNKDEGKSPPYLGDVVHFCTQQSGHREMLCLIVLIIQSRMKFFMIKDD